ncbi:FecCD family ABC transporter permease [Paracoccus ravus]|uniref:FecCD family ABC transporter permease n=1 Tax=Paracoccus ravus TaxID=2447760 RepID=UPI001ADA4957|nr:iron ABC transporter permease [Paracoccus ravus]
MRLPRAQKAVVVGASLGVAGAIRQAIMRNPLAWPGLLGINSGAALAATAIIVEFRTIPQDLLTLLIFAGALVMSAAIYAFSWRQGTSSVRIILIGIGLGPLAGAGASFISSFGDPPAVQRAMIWLSGSLQDSRWERVRILALWSIPPFVAAWIAARELDLIAFGDTVARRLGQRVNLLRGMAVLICAALSGAAIAAAGLIGFVGLAARRIMPPVQLPVGLFTALLGAPFFGFLLWKRRNA